MYNGANFEVAKKRTFLPSKNVISPGETTYLMILWFSSRKMILHAGLHARMRTKSRPSSFLRDIIRKIWSCIPDFAGLVRCLGPGRASYLIVGVTFNVVARLWRFLFGVELALDATILLDRLCGLRRRAEQR